MRVLAHLIPIVSPQIVPKNGHLILLLSPQAITTDCCTWATTIGIKQTDNNRICGRRENTGEGGTFNNGICGRRENTGEVPKYR